MYNIQKIKKFSKINERNTFNIIDFTYWPNINYIFLVVKRIEKYDQSFIKDLYDKMIKKDNFIVPDIFKEYKELFEKYVPKGDGGLGLPFDKGIGQNLTSLLIMGATDAFLFIGVLLQTYREII